MVMNLPYLLDRGFTKKCRKRYCNKRSIASDLKPNVECGLKRKLRSQTEQFLFGEHCFFCGQNAEVNGKKGHQAYPVKTFEFQRKIESACDDRGQDDEWAKQVKARFSLVSDLHAADAIYHQACSINSEHTSSFQSLFKVILRVNEPLDVPKMNIKQPHLSELRNI